MVIVGTPVDQDDVAAAADANFITHVSWVQERAGGMRVLADRELVLVDSGLSCDTFNFLCRARLEGSSTLERVREAIAYFRAVDRPFSWWVGPVDQPPDLGEFLLAEGLEQAETELAMAADLASLRVGDLSPSGLRIERVRTATQIYDFAQINAANWTPPDPLVLRFYELAASVLLDPDSPLWLYLGYLSEIPVATAELTIGGGVVGLYNICTLEAYRRRGFGSALTLQPLLDARSSGYQTGILQAAPDGVGVYTRVGFQPFGRITEYKPPINENFQSS
ncbi:MAG: GNAT family N-acetyltransferase [Acidobacteria bacterium]|nr:GNAT family N-acetyltransferase [Acidobacteriota bacterium]